tara:strand:- start:59 stop:487 length:429 start_codon:yes stop_codon:yes gene_type:complete
MTDRPIIVHSLEDAKTAISIASSQNLNVILRSAPGAGGYLGPQVFYEIIEQAKIGYEGTKVQAVFDCGNDTGIALNALRHGIKVIRIDVPTKTLKKISDIAKQLKASVESAHSNKTIISTEALDLLDLDDPESAIRSWLKED